MMEDVHFDEKRCKNIRGAFEPERIATETGRAIQSIANNIDILSKNHNVMSKQLNVMKGKIETIELQNTQLAEKLDDFIHSTEIRFDTLNRTITTEINRLDDKIDDGFERVDKRMDGLERKVDGLDQKVDGLDQKVDTIKDEIITALRVAVDEVARRSLPAS